MNFDKIVKELSSVVPKSKSKIREILVEIYDVGYNDGIDMEYGKSVEKSKIKR